jgi:hypothetical protein
MLQCCIELEANKVQNLSHFALSKIFTYLDKIYTNLLLLFFNSKENDRIYFSFQPQLWTQTNVPSDFFLADT